MVQVLLASCRRKTQLFPCQNDVNDWCSLWFWFATGREYFELMLKPQHALPTCIICLVSHIYIWTHTHTYVYTHTITPPHSCVNSLHHFSVHLLFPYCLLSIMNFRWSIISWTQPVTPETAAEFCLTWNFYFAFWHV